MKESTLKERVACVVRESPGISKEQVWEHFKNVRGVERYRVFRALWNLNHSGVLRVTYDTTPHGFVVNDKWFPGDAE